MTLQLRRLLLPAIIIARSVAVLAASFFIAPLGPAPVRAGAAPPAQSIALRPFAGSTASGFSVTRIAHASVLLDFGNAKVLTDPWFSEKMHFHHGEPLAMSMEQLSKLTAIVASHAHYDHFGIETLKRYPDKAVPFFVGPDMADAARAAGFTNVRELRTWEAATVGPLTIAAAPAAHKVPEITFVIQANGSTVYFGGDTRLIPELRELPKRFPSIHLALLSVNGLRVLGEQVVMNARARRLNWRACWALRWRCPCTTASRAVGSPTAQRAGASVAGQARARQAFHDHRCGQNRDGRGRVAAQRRGAIG